MRKEPRRAQDRVRRLRVVGRCLVRIPRHIVLGPNSTSQHAHALISSRTQDSGSTHFSVSCGCGIFEYPPSSNLCTWSKFVIRCAAVPVPSPSKYEDHSSFWNHSPFCLTFSKEATRSESEPGNALRCCACCCIADGGRCASNLTPGGSCG